MKKHILLFIMTLGLTTGFVACNNESKANVEYYCPMHPEVVQDEPGNCPKCNMKLEKREKTSSGNDTTHSENQSH